VTLCGKPQRSLRVLPQSSLTAFQAHRESSSLPEGAKGVLLRAPFLLLALTCCGGRETAPSRKAPGLPAFPGGKVRVRDGKWRYPQENARNPGGTPFLLRQNLLCYQIQTALTLRVGGSAYALRLL
jgi:hypothetical protein